MLGKKQPYGRVPRRGRKIIVKIVGFSSVLVFVAAAAYLAYRLTRRSSRNSTSVSALYTYWNEGNNQRVYDIAGAILDRDPLHNTARTFRGFSAFKLGFAEPDDMTQRQNYFDRAINDLRVALQSARRDSVGQIEYVLGLTYFHKNKSSSFHYYADLAVKYLEEAQKNGYKSDDISELLGLSYADLGDTDKSIAAFSGALLVRESDTLLYNIAKQYYKNGEGGVAKQYLVRALQLSNDDDILIKSHAILGQIYTDEKNFASARSEFESILEKNINSADAHYGLGVLYEQQGDMAKARAEWRSCLKLQPGYPSAMKKLSEIK